MSDTPATPYDYQSEGGALLLDAPTYVKRHADDELYEGLKAGQFCYVLNARQMGKSSLKVRTLQRLREEGIACAAVDLQGIGTTATEEQWYFGIISRIARSLGLHRQINLNTWWTEQPRLSYVQRFVESLETLLLPVIAEPIVIFIDEVDLTLNLAFRDDFFGALRESYNRRADEPEYRRLTFALFGVASPSDLMQNKQATPFNIGRPVDLTGFHQSEAQPLLPGLAAKTSQPQAVLQTVLEWTGGQPFLTQKLCKLVQVADSTPPQGHESQWVEQLVQTKVIDNWEAQDIPPHLKTIRDRLLLTGEQRSGLLLGLYQQIVQQGEIPANDSPEQLELRLTGLVVKRDERLRVYNRIYQQVFDRNWVETELAKLRPVYYGAAIAVWLASAQQDEWCLLRGQMLQDARDWAEGKSLADDDRRFLDASLAFEGQEVQRKFEAEAEANQILLAARQQIETELEKANQQLATVKHRVKRQTVMGGTILAVSGVALIASLTGAWLAMERAAAADQRTAIEAQSQAALRQFDANQTEALATALGAGESLRSLLHKRARQNGLFGAEKSHSLEHYPTFSPLMALHQILNTIQERQIPLLGGSVQGLRWTPDGDIVAIGGNDRTVKLLSPEGALIAEIQANQATVNSLGWTSAGDTLATGGSDGTLKLWTREGVLITEIQANQGEIYSLGWSADRAVLATSGSDGTLKLWAREGTLITEIQANQGDIKSLAWTADGTVLATSGSDGTVKLWNQSGEFISVIQADPFDRVIILAWSPDGQTLATGGYNHFRLWAPNGNLIKDVQTFQDWVNSLSWSSDGQTLATGGENGTVKLWNLAGDLIDDVKATQGTIRDLAWDPNGKILAIGGQDGQAKLWSRTNEFNTEIQANQGDYYSLSWTSDGQILASGGNDGTVKLWSSDGDLMTTLVTQQGRLWSVAWTPDGEILATGGDVGNAKLWQRDGTLIADIPADQGWAFSLSWSADGQTLATTGGIGKTVKLWRRDGTFISEIETQQRIVRTVRWVGHEQLLSTGAEDGTIKLWQTDGTPVQTIQAHDVKVWSMDWSPEGDILAIGADNGRVKLLRQDATVIAEMQAHQGLIWMLTWTPDGQILATSGNDGFIRLWSRSGSLITELQADQGTIYGLAWSHDGKKLAAGGHHGVVKLWALEDLDTLLAKGCNWLDSYLSASSKASNGRAICQNPKAEATQ